MVRAHMASAAFAALLTLSATTAFAADAGALSQESPDQWRASKLAGVAIYGPDNRSVGKISDVLMSKDGKAEYVIVGVGGFLGIGEKDVAIPYDQVKFTDQPIVSPANPAGFNNAMGGTAENGGVAPAVNNTMASAVATGTPNAPVGGMAPNGGIAPATTVGLGTPADTLGTPTAPAMAGASGPASGAAAPARSTAYPDHGTIDMTADQLKSAPTFKFAS